MKNEPNIHMRSHEQEVAWEILGHSPTVRMLAALNGPYWPHPTAKQLLQTSRTSEDVAERQVHCAEATRYQTPTPDRSFVERRESLLDDALDDSFPASDPPAIVAPAYGGWRQNRG